MYPRTALQHLNLCVNDSTQLILKPCNLRIFITFTLSVNYFLSALLNRHVVICKDRGNKFVILINHCVKDKIIMLIWFKFNFNTNQKQKNAIFSWKWLIWCWNIRKNQKNHFKIALINDYWITKNPLGEYYQRLVTSCVDCLNYV